MDEQDDSRDGFDVDRALDRLASRVAWLRWGLWAALALCAGLAWWVAADVRVIASDPLRPVITGIDIPPPTLNASRTMERGISATERALAIVGALCLVMTGLVYRSAEGFKRHAVLAAGAVMVVLVLIAQWTTSGDQRANLDVERLARAGAWEDLRSLVKSRPGMPYATYIEAQALVMAGGQSRLKAEYGDWLARWSAQAARHGYLGAVRPTPGLPVWEGIHASPQVMRALEIAAFGNAPTPFTRPYLTDSLARLSRAKRELNRVVPALALAMLGCVGLFVTWRRARRNLRLAEECVVKFDYYGDSPSQAPRATALAPLGTPLRTSTQP